MTAAQATARSMKRIRGSAAKDRANARLALSLARSMTKTDRARRRREAALMGVIEHLTREVQTLQAAVDLRDLPTVPPADGKWLGVNEPPEETHHAE